MLRILLQHLPEMREMNLTLLVGSIFFIVTWALTVLIAFILFRYHQEYGTTGGGGNRDVGSWLDEKMLAKLSKMAGKLDIVLEKKLTNKKNQKLFDELDKNERKSAVSAIFYQFMSWIPGHMIIISFEHMHKTVRKILFRATVLVKSRRNKLLNSLLSERRSLCRNRSLL